MDPAVAALLEVMIHPLFIAGVILIVILLIILKLTSRVEHKLSGEVSYRKESEKTKYERALDNMQEGNKPAEAVLVSIDKLARDFFAEKYSIAKDFDYSEVRDIFLKRSEPLIAGFAVNMLESLYSGKKVQPEMITTLIREMRSIVLQHEAAELQKKVEKTVQIQNQIPMQQAQAQPKEQSPPMKQPQQQQSMQNPKMPAFDDKEEPEQDPEPVVEQQPKQPTQSFPKFTLPMHREEKPLNIKIPKRSAQTQGKEPENHRNIGSIDDLGRIGDRLKRDGKIK